MIPDCYLGTVPLEGGPPLPQSTATALGMYQAHHERGATSDWRAYHLGDRAPGERWPSAVWKGVFLRCCIPNLTSPARVGGPGSTLY